VNAAIVTARKGSESIPDKNVLEVADRPLVSYPIKAAKEADRVDAVYVSTNGEKIKTVAEDHDCEIIWRPKRLWGDRVNHGDVIKHATEEVDNRESDLENVVVLLGNLTMIDADLIDLSLEVLANNPAVDSTMSVWHAEDDHPQRAMAVDEDGYLQPYGGERDASTNRQAYTPAYFYDQGPWTFRKETVQRREGPNPWWWMGENCRPIVRTWSTGRDVHTLFDAAMHALYEQNRDELRELEERTPYDHLDDVSHGEK
jgi:CMP-N-acetylneuraminic acid synthetase